MRQFGHEQFSGSLTCCTRQNHTRTFIQTNSRLVKPPLHLKVIFYSQQINSNFYSPQSDRTWVGMCRRTVRFKSSASVRSRTHAGRHHKQQGCNCDNKTKNNNKSTININNEVSQRTQTTPPEFTDRSREVPSNHQTKNTAGCTVETRAANYMHQSRQVQNALATEWRGTPIRWSTDQWHHDQLPVHYKHNCLGKISDHDNALGLVLVLELCLFNVLFCLFSYYWIIDHRIVKAQNDYLCQCSLSLARHMTVYSVNMAQQVKGGKRTVS